MWRLSRRSDAKYHGDQSGNDRVGGMRTVGRVDNQRTAAAVVAAPCSSEDGALIRFCVTPPSFATVRHSCEEDVNGLL